MGILSVLHLLLLRQSPVRNLLQAGIVGCLLIVLDVLDVELFRVNPPKEAASRQ
jgi:hypothetical protein